MDGSPLKQGARQHKRTNRNSRAPTLAAAIHPAHPHDYGNIGGRIARKDHNEHRWTRQAYHSQRDTEADKGQTEVFTHGRNRDGFRPRVFLGRDNGVGEGQTELFHGTTASPPANPDAEGTANPARDSCRALGSATEKGFQNRSSCDY